jgi:sulfur relay (sulfurtransferase) DsrC/TusE family protein
LLPFASNDSSGDRTYLVEVDDWLPEVVLLLVEVSHTDLSEVTWMVLVHVRSVVMLTTSKTTSTGMLAVLSYTTFTGGNMTAAVHRKFY